MQSVTSPLQATVKLVSKYFCFQRKFFRCESEEGTYVSGGRTQLILMLGTEWEDSSLHVLVHGCLTPRESVSGKN